MTTLMHDAWAAALLDPAAPVPPGLRTWNGSNPEVRFGVYRNNVASALVAALGDTFAVVRELVGGDFFDAMARCFAAAHPPTSPVLAEYGDAMPGFIASFGPARSLPYLADVARVEIARVRAFHAADAPSLAPAQIALRLARPEALPRARLVLHPSVHVLRSPCAIVSLWAAHQGLGAIEAVDPLQPEAALVLREDDDAAVIRVPLADADFIAALQAGASLAEATAAAHRTDTAFDPGTALATLIGHGAIADWIEPTTTPEDTTP